MTNNFHFKYRHRKKKLKLGKQNVKTNEWLGNLCTALKTNTDPRVSDTVSRRFLKQNYPKYISNVLSKILEKKNHNYQMFCPNLWSS